jgi:hypothetical protein
LSATFTLRNARHVPELFRETLPETLPNFGQTELQDFIF